MLLRSIALVCGFLICAPAQAAEDFSTSTAYRYLSQTCLRALANPKDVRAMAEAAKLQRVTDPALLNTFVGPNAGNNGAAWTFPRSYGGTFTLSLRPNGTCAIWAESGDPQAAEALFRKLVAGAGNTGATVTTDDDQSFTTATGKARVLVMSVISKDQAGYEFTFMAGDRPGAFFNGTQIQFTMQMRRLPTKK